MLSIRTRCKRLLGKVRKIGISVHTLIQPPSQCGCCVQQNVYYVSFIDDYSRKTWIYFLKGKNEVFSKFKEFKALVENLSEKKI